MLGWESFLLGKDWPSNLSLNYLCLYVNKNATLLSFRPRPLHKKAAAQVPK
jgi:hypothetical protein